MAPRGSEPGSVKPQRDGESHTPETTFAWLIEAPGPHYLGARRLGRNEFWWTADANKALRFYDQDQADLVLMALRELAPELFAFVRALGDPRPSEHGWIAKAPPPDRQVAGDETREDHHG